MADAVLDDGKCLLPTCRRSGPLIIFRVKADRKLIECATERHDDETRSKVQAILDSQGEQASVQLHKNCYCSFTSKDHIKKLVAGIMWELCGTRMLKVIFGRLKLTCDNHVIHFDYVLEHWKKIWNFL